MSDAVCNVLFLCTGNSARSIVAEALLNTMGGTRFRGYSAGSHPGANVNPLVRQYLESKGIDIGHARSKSWHEFATPDAPRMDLVITVCDEAAGESCPVWPGRPARAHWSAPDPASYMEDPAHARRIIEQVFELMQRRMARLIALLDANLDTASLQAEARAIAAAVPAP